MKYIRPLNEAKEYKAGDTVKINQVVKGPRPQFNTYRTKVKGKQVDFGTKDIREGKLNEGKGSELATKTIADLRKKFRKLNDAELEEFMKDLAYAFNLQTK